MRKSATSKKIMGLVSGFEYKTKELIEKKLRYGKIVFMTDQDLDGSHIKGLGVNLFQSQWHDLVKNDDFIGFMNTPILKAKKGKSEKVFYNDGEYEEWKKTNDTKGWKIKYYKGLGTSTAKEFKEYFEEKKMVSLNTLEKIVMIQLIWYSTRSALTTAKIGLEIIHAMISLIQINRQSLMRNSSRVK